MVYDNVIDLLGIDDFTDLIKLAFCKRGLDAVDEANFLIHDKERVIGNAPWCRKAVEIRAGPIADAHIKNIFGNFFRFHGLHPSVSVSYIYI